MPRMMKRAQQREKTLVCYCPFCREPMKVTYDGTGSAWERSTDLPTKCTNGHFLSIELTDALHDALDERARAGVGDDDPRDHDFYDG